MTDDLRDETAHTAEASDLLFDDDVAPDPDGDADGALADGRPVTDGEEAAAPSDEPPVAEATEAVLEALLFVAERPLGRAEIGRLLASDRETVDALVGDLEVSLTGRGIRLIAAGDVVALATAPEAGQVIARYVGAEPGRLSPSALETLAIVAYRQPVTKAVVERIRGVDSDYTLRSLAHRRLVVELGRALAPGRPILYGTGIEFLARFGLATLDELPPLGAETAGPLADLSGEAGLIADFSGAAAAHADMED
jgi:segregation and condensation protein B